MPELDISDHVYNWIADFFTGHSYWTYYGGSGSQVKSFSVSIRSDAMATQEVGPVAAINAIFNCLIAIAYSMRQIINSVCLCHSLSVRLSVCLSVRTLTIAFLDQFSPKVAPR